MIGRFALVVLAVTHAWIKLEWTAPGDPQPDGTWAQCVSYECQRWDAGVNWFPTLLRRDSTQSAPLVTPAPPGTHEMGFVDVPVSEQEWRNGGMALHLRTADAAGNVSNWSGRIVGIVGPDTVWMLKRWRTGVPYYPQALAGRSVWFSLPQEDDFYATVAHLEDVNRAEIPWVCGKLGLYWPDGPHWCLRGVRQMCPPPRPKLPPRVGDLRADSTAARVRGRSKG